METLHAVCGEGDESSEGSKGIESASRASRNRQTSSPKPTKHPSSKWNECHGPRFDMLGPTANGRLLFWVGPIFLLALVVLVGFSSLLKPDLHSDIRTWIAGDTTNVVSYGSVLEEPRQPAGTNLSLYAPSNLFADRCLPPLAPSGPTPPNQCENTTNPPFEIARYKVYAPPVARAGIYLFNVTVTCGNNESDTVSNAILEARLVGPIIVAATAKNLGNGNYRFEAEVHEPGNYVVHVRSLEVPYDWAKLGKPVNVLRDGQTVGLKYVEIRPAKGDLQPLSKGFWKWTNEAELTNAFEYPDPYHWYTASRLPLRTRTAVEVQDILRGKTILFIGDSNARGMFAAVMRLAGVNFDEIPEIHKIRTQEAFYFPDLQVRFVYVFSGWGNDELFWGNMTSFDIAFASLGSWHADVNQISRRKVQLQIGEFFRRVGEKGRNVVFGTSPPWPHVYLRRTRTQARVEYINCLAREVADSMSVPLVDTFQLAASRPFETCDNAHYVCSWRLKKPLPLDFWHAQVVVQAFVEVWERDEGEEEEED